jgi:hypothetical protein
MKHNLAVKQEQENFTYGDYLTWPYEERWQIIEGIAYYLHSPIKIKNGGYFSDFHPPSVPGIPA